MAKLIQPCTATICTGLRIEQRKLARLRTDGKLAAAAYAPPGQRDALLPEGYREATPEQLSEMRLSPAMLEHPANGAGEPTDFRAAVFVNEKTGERVIAFKGSSGAITLDPNTDWGNNIRQGMGKDSFYYKQAQTIATKVAASPFGQSAEYAKLRYAGHSLGGGLASAASRVSGRPASTFNAASLNVDTVPKPDFSGVIDAVNVRGDPLTRLNQGMLGTTANTAAYPLDPPDDLGATIAKNVPWWNLKQKAQAFGQRQLELHSMDTVNKALAKREKQVEAELVKNKCG